MNKPFEGSAPPNPALPLFPNSRNDQQTENPPAFHRLFMIGSRLLQASQSSPPLERRRAWVSAPVPPTQSAKQRANPQQQLEGLVVRRLFIGRFVLEALPTSSSPLCIVFFFF